MVCGGQRKVFDSNTPWGKNQDFLANFFKSPNLMFWGESSICGIHITIIITFNHTTGIGIVRNWLGWAGPHWLSVLWIMTRADMWHYGGCVLHVCMVGEKSRLHTYKIAFTKDSKVATRDWDSFTKRTELCPRCCVVEEKHRLHTHNDSIWLRARKSRPIHYASISFQLLVLDIGLGYE